jgi:hypothetical protein
LALLAEFQRCWPWLAAALRRGRDADVKPEALLALLQSNQAQLWPGERCALVTQLINTPEGRCLHVWLGGGDLKSLLDLRAGIEAWGRVQGAEFATIDGRRGWDRLFRPFGYGRAGGEVFKRL